MIVPDGYVNLLVEWIVVCLFPKRRRTRRIPMTYAPFFSPSRLAFRFPRLGKLSRVLQERAVYRALSQYEGRTDIVYAHFLGNAFSAHRWCKENGIPLFVVSGESSYQHFYKDLAKGALKKFFTSVDHLFFVSEKNEDAFYSFWGDYKGSASILPNAVDTRVFTPGDKATLRRKLGLPADKRLAAFLGYFIERKGPLRVLEAIRNVDDLGGVFIGTGIQRPVGAKVIFAGTMENSEVPAWLGACDVFVLPSLDEGRSNAILEALACGLPVVVSDRSFNREFLNERCAVFVDPQDPSSIAEGIQSVLRSPDVSQQMACAARELAENFSLGWRARRFLSECRGRNGIRRPLGNCPKHEGPQDSAS